MWLKVNNIGSGLIGTHNFKYALTTNSSSCTTDVIASGDFYGVNNGAEVLLLDGKQYSQTTAADTYYLYIWLDPLEDTQATQNQPFNITIGGVCTDEIDVTDNVNSENMLYADFGGDTELFKNSAYIDNISKIEFVNYTNTDGLSGLNLTNSVSPSYIPSDSNTFSVNQVVNIPTVKFPLGKRGNIDVVTTERNYDIMGWFEEDPDDASKYVLKIGTNGNKIYAGRTLSSAFTGMNNVSMISNIDMLDARFVNNMSFMFAGFGRRASNLNLYLGNNFNAGNVTDMSFMFVGSGFYSNEFNLDLGNNFNASNAINVMTMFSGSGQNALNFSLYLGNNFNLCKASSTSGIFSQVGQNSTNFDFNLGNNFNASNVRDMSTMFSGAGRYSTNFSINLGNNFNSVNVTNLMAIFAEAGEQASNFSLDLGNSFDITNAINMQASFRGVGRNSSTAFVLDLSTSNFDNVTDRINMFNNFGNNKATIYVKDSAAQNWIISKNSEWGTNFSVSNVLIK